MIRGQNEEHLCCVLFRLHTERRPVGVVVLEPQILLGLLGVQPPMVLHGPLLMGIPDGLGSAEGAQPPQTLLTPN